MDPLLLQQPKPPVLENYDTIPSPVLSNHLVFQLPWARPKFASIAAIFVQQLTSSRNPQVCESHLFKWPPKSELA